MVPASSIFCMFGMMRVVILILPSLRRLRFLLIGILITAVEKKEDRPATAASRPSVDHLHNSPHACVSWLHSFGDGAVRGLEDRRGGITAPCPADGNINDTWHIAQKRP